MHQKAATRITLALVLFLNVFMFFHMERLIQAFVRFPFDTDEAAHALTAQYFAADLVQFNFRALMKDFYRLAYYPPVGALLKAPTYIVFGVSNYSARVFSLICLVISTVLIYLIGLRLNRTYGWFLGLLAVSLTLSSIAILLAASMSMLEMPGLMVCMFALWFYLVGLDRNSWLLNLGLGCTLAAVMLTKYPYGIVMTIAIAANEVLEAFLSRKIPGRRWLLICFPFCLILTGWFWEPWKIYAFLGYSNAQQHGLDLYTIENFLYYPRTLHLHYFPSALFSLFGIASLIWSAYRFRDKKQRAVFLYFLVGVAIITIESLKNIRYIATFVPALYVLIGITLVAIWERLRDSLKSVLLRRAVSVAFLVLILVGGAPAYGKLRQIAPALQVTYETDPRLLDIQEWIIFQTNGESFCVVEPWDKVNLLALQWAALSQNPEKILHPKMVKIGQCKVSRRENKLEVRELRGQIPNSSYLVVLSRPESASSKYPLWLKSTMPLVAVRSIKYEDYWDLFAHDLSQLTQAKLEELQTEGRNIKSLTVYIFKLQS